MDNNSEKFFIITIDTEADNQWDSNHECSTNNAKYLQRFQELAEKYNYKPVWLTTYEMANDDFFVDYFKKKQDDKLCEIGMHLHAWNNPPEYKLKSKINERSYLIEYPTDIMEKKFKILDELLTKKFNIKPISHRAGRWAMNENYFNILNKYNYKIDCSITPGINWKNSLGETGLPGPNYKTEDVCKNIKYNILEVPVTVKNIRYFNINNIKSIRGLIKEILFYLKGKKQWIRPNNSFDIKPIIKAIKKCNRKNEYIMFMIHSSELMPGGSPYFKTEDDIEKLYHIIEKIFDYSNNLGYVGITLRDYYLINDRKRAITK